MKPGPALDLALFVLAAAAMVAALFLALRDPPLAYPTTTAQLMEVLDPNGDGQLTRAEYELLAPKGGSFALLDQDDDQRLDAREIELLLLTVSPDFHRSALDGD